MLKVSTVITYPILTMLSIGKKSFANLGKIIKKNGQTIARLVAPAAVSEEVAQKIAQKIFSKKKHLFVIVDDTLIKKFFSRFMQGAGMFFDTKIGRQIMAYKLVIGVLSDGKIAIPFKSAYEFSKELTEQLSEKFLTKVDFAKTFVLAAIALFPGKKITVLVDGIYITKDFMRWCYERKIRLDGRFRCNAVVKYKGKMWKVAELAQQKRIYPKGRQIGRTIAVEWHDMHLWLTIEKIFDNDGLESLLFQISTYQGSPQEHIGNYKNRWGVEKLNRTSKQSGGVQDCYSCSLETQKNHVAAVLLAYAFMQLEMKEQRLKSPEEALRRCKKRNVDFLTRRFSRFLDDEVLIYG